MTGRLRGAAALAWMLAGYGLFTVCLVLAGYRSGGAELAILVATGATSVAVPIGGLIALLIAHWQEPTVDAPAPSLPDPVRPVAAGSVFVVGNGTETVSVRVDRDGVSIGTGGIGNDAGDPSRSSSTEGASDVSAPRHEDQA